MSNVNTQDSVERTLEKLKEVFGSEFKTYYDGDPLQIPLFNLPAIIVDQPGDDTEAGTMGQDDIKDELIIKVVMDKRADFTGSQVDTTDMTSKKIRKYVSRRDPNTGDYAENTVKYVVRNLLLDGITAVLSDIRVDYGINPRPGGEKFAELTQEGHVSFSIQYSVDLI